MLTLTLVIIIMTVISVCSLADTGATAYTRTQDDVTRIVVGAPAKDAVKVSPRIYSNFLEHLGNVVNDILWANAVFNPQFGANKNGELERWKLANGAEWLKEGPAGRSVRLPANAIVSQLLAIPASRESDYKGSVWARANGGTPAILDVELLRQDKPTVILKTAVKVNAAEWKQHKFRITLLENALDKGETPELRITSRQGDASIANVEIFPNDAIDGVDPQVLAATKALHIELLRWPGGNFVSGYHWRSGIGPRVNRPTMPNPAWNGMETHHFGTDEFMLFCKHVGTKPQICINAGDGTPEEAAEWVEYCNGSEDTPMGRLRAENGHPAPYNVRVWEIGNELYGGWQIGHTDPEGNAERYARFSKAMLAVDPTIEILATGKGDGSTPGGVNSDNAWNIAVLKSAKSNGRMPKYLSLHPLVSLPGDMRKFTYEEVYDSAMAHPQWWEKTYIPQLRKLTEDVLGADTPVMFAPTEWGIILGGPDWPRFPNHDAQSGAVYGALFMQSMLRSGKYVSLSNVTALVHGGGIKRFGGRFYCDPLYYACQLYGVARIASLLPVTVEGPGYDVPERAFLPAVSNVPWLDVVAGDAKGGARWLFVVNRHPDQARTADITLPSPVADIEVETLAAGPMERNGLDRPTNVLPKTRTVQVGGAKLAYEFPACSITAFRLK